MANFFTSLFGGGKSEMGDIKAPDYWTDPNFQSNQDFGTNFFQNWLQGQIPSYWQAIGNPVGQTYGGNQLMGDYVTESTADMKKAAMEEAAARGTGRGGTLSGDWMDSINNMSATLRYADYLRAMEGRQNLLGFGGAGFQDVRNAAFNNMGTRNAFNQQNYQTEINKQKYLDDYNSAQGARLGQSIGTIGGGLLGGMFGGGMAGALAGANIGGGAFGGGGISSGQPMQTILGSQGSFDDNPLKFLENLLKKSKSSSSGGGLIGALGQTGIMGTGIV